MAKKLQKKYSELSIEEKTKLLLKSCKTKSELSQWIKFFLNIDLPDVKVSRYANSTPLDSVWDIYRICVLKQNPDNIQELLYVASRGSGKSLGAAIAEFLVMLHDKRDVAHIGVIMSQAKRCSEYQNGFYLSPKIREIISPAEVKEEDRILQKNTMEKSVFNIDKETCTMEVLPLTLRAVNGPHVQLCIGGSTKILVDNRDRIVTGTKLTNRDRVSISAGKLYRMIRSGVAINAISYNDSTGFLESKRITRAICSGKKTRLKIKRTSGTPLWCTSDHNLWDPITNCYRSASTFKVGDRVLTSKKKFLGNRKFLKRTISTQLYPSAMDDASSADQILLGSMLGDGGVYKRWPGSTGAVYAEHHGPKQIGYALWKRSKLEGYLTFLDNAKSYSGYSDHVGIRIHTKANSKILPYASFKKKFDLTILDKLDTLGLAVWYADDGHRHKFCTHSFSVEQIQQLQVVMKNNFDIETRIVAEVQKGKTYPVLTLRTPLDYAKLYKRIYNSIPLGMRYKLDNYRGIYRCKTCNALEFRVNTSNNAKICVDCINSNASDCELDTISSIELIDSNRLVYDFTVEDNHNFLAGGILVHNCIVDEVDTASGESLKAFKEISGCLDTKKGKKPLRVGISTRKSTFGLMHKMIESADKEKRTVRMWTALEFTERCPDDRSGTVPTEYFVNPSTGESIIKDEWEKKDLQKKKEFESVIALDKCGVCPALPYCRSDAKLQTSKSPMLKTIDELNKKILSEGHDWAASQLFNLKPSLEGIVFREFDDKVHFKNWNEMWKLLTGRDFPGECTHDLFIKKCFSKDTEVLTNNGFKSFTDLTPYDTVASLDDEGRLVYEKPVDYISYRYTGKMVNIFNDIGRRRYLDMLITPNHDQVYLHGRNYRKQQQVKFLKARADELADLPCDFYIPSTWLKESKDKRGYNSPISFMTNDQFYTFMGLWLSEGNLGTQHGKGRRNDCVFVCQFKDDASVVKVDKLMRSIDWPDGKMHYRQDARNKRGGVWAVSNKELCTYLRPLELCVNKRIPRIILENASRKQLTILLEWLTFGDGSYMFDGSKQQPYYSTSSLKLANDVQELCFRLGIRSGFSDYGAPDEYRKDGTRHFPRYRVNFHYKNKGLPADKNWYINNSTNRSLYADKVQSNIGYVDYDDVVYCVTMPSGKLFTRRNGVISLSGNCHEQELMCVAGLDFGWSSPSTIVYMFIDKRDNIFVVRAEGMTFVNDPTWIHHVNVKYHRMYKCQLYFPDIANGSAVDLMKQAGLPVCDKFDKSINLGIQVIKRFMRLPGTGESKIFFARETARPVFDELTKYHYKLDAAGVITNDPEDSNNHFIDPLRYILVMLFGKSQGLVSMQDMELDGPAKNGVFHHAPSPSEFAQLHGIAYRDNTNEVKDIGKVGTLVELEGKDEDDEDGSNSGFLWNLND